MELADLHHPDCRMSRQNNEQRTGEKGDAAADAADAAASLSGGGVREIDASDSLLLTPEAYKATEAVEFIAEHLRNEDEYMQVSFPEWSFVVLSGRVL